MHLWSTDTNLHLFTPVEYEKLPEGTVLESINGQKVTKGEDYIDMDVRFGHIAFGVRDPFNHPLKNLFLLFVITGA